jgi:arabinan endo-1,5-alpha-L-arabinosidase
VIEANGVFYRFWTGDNIPMASSTDLKQWQSGSAVYRNGYPNWVANWRADNPGNTFNFPWAPDVSFFGGQYHMYASFSAFFGQNVSCISHLTTTNIAAGDWVDHGPVVCTDGSQNYNAIDPDVGLDTEGKAWLAFGSFWDGIQAFELDVAGNRVGNSLAPLAWAPQIEAPVLFRRCGYYYLFVSWGLCCPGEGRSVDDLTYRVVVGRSENILGPYVDRDGVPLLDGGGTLVLEGDGVQFAAAGHSDVLVSGATIYHVYHAYRQTNGNATLRIVQMPFDAAGWPVPGGP